MKRMLVLLLLLFGCLQQAEFLHGCYELDGFDYITSQNEPSNIDVLLQNPDVSVNVWCGSMNSDNGTEWLAYGTCKGVAQYRIVRVNGKANPTEVCYEG